MAVDDLWYRRTRNPETGDRMPSKRHGRGKRWRVRWTDPETGQPRTESFERRADAERHDANMHADISRGQYVDPRAGQITVGEYAELWRKTQSTETAPPSGPSGLSAVTSCPSSEDCSSLECGARTSRAG
jgi:hypothetical protein